MGIWSVLRRGLETTGEPTGATQPSFEHLEPRLLLSADPAGLAGQISPDFLDDPGDAEAAIVVDFDYIQAVDDQGIAATEANSQQAQSGSQTHESGQVESGFTGVKLSESTVLSTTVEPTEQPVALGGSSPNSEYRIANTDLVIDSHTEGSIEPRGPPTEIVFIDSSLNQDFQLENAVSTGVVVSVFDANQDGLNHITNVLSSYSNLSAIHILSHGAAGSLSLGSSILDSGSLESYADTLTTWGQRLTADGTWKSGPGRSRPRCWGRAIWRALKGFLSAIIRSPGRPRRKKTISRLARPRPSRWTRILENSTCQ